MKSYQTEAGLVNMAWGAFTPKPYIPLFLVMLYLPWGDTGKTFQVFQRMSCN